MGGNEYCDAVVARQMDERAPKLVPFHRIHPRGRFIEKEHGRVMQDSDGKLEPLLYAKRQVWGKPIGDIFQVILPKQLLDPAINLVCGQMIEMSMQFEILPDREFGIERERL